MIRHSKKRICSNRGFTLAETLMAVLILLMVTSVVAVGVPLASNAYNKITNAANAQVYLSTTVTRLRNELGTASNITVSAGGDSISYTAANGSTSRIFLGASSAPGIYIREYADIVSDNDNFLHLLVSKQASGSDMYSTFGSISYADGVITITNLRVIKGSDTAAELASLKIRVLTYH